MFEDSPQHVLTAMNRVERLQSLAGASLHFRSTDTIPYPHSGPVLKVSHISTKLDIWNRSKPSVVSQRSLSPLGWRRFAFCRVENPTGFPQAKSPDFLRFLKIPCRPIWRSSQGQALLEATAIAAPSSITQTSNVFDRSCFSL